MGFPPLSLVVVLQHTLLRWAPDLSRAAHFVILLALTVSTTIAASTFLYRYLEAPGIRIGRVLAVRLGREAKPAQGITFEQPRPAD